MLESLAWNAKSIREVANAPRTAIAAKAGVSEATIIAFEAAKAWPRDVESIVRAYAELTGWSYQKIWSEAVGALGK